MAGVFVYVVAVMDWYSQFVLCWALSVKGSGFTTMTGRNKAWRIGHQPSATGKREAGKKMKSGTDLRGDSGFCREELMAWCETHLPD